MTRLLATLGNGAILLWRVIRSLPRMEWREAIHQAHALANRSAFFVVVTMGFVGTILILQAAGQARGLIGDLSLIGPGFLQLIVSEFGPVTVALLIAARYGAGVAAEIGAMTITEQIDALRMTGTDPVAFLVAPRVVGGMIGMLPICVLGTAAAWLAGALAGSFGFEMSWATYSGTFLTHGSDVVIGLCKALVFGALVPLVASAAGLRATGGAPGVGHATTEAVIGGSVALLAADLCVGLVGYVVVMGGV